jgi:hypothetical protein
MRTDCPICVNATTTARVAKVMRIDGSRIGRFDQIDAQNAPNVSGRFGATLR